MNNEWNEFAIKDDVLALITIGHSPMIAKTRKAVGTRLSITAVRPLSAGALVQRMASSFSRFKSTVFIGFYGVEYGNDLMDCDIPNNVVLEIPGDAFNRVEVQTLVRELHVKGVSLAIRGRAEKPLAPDFVDIFKYSIMHASEEKRVKREIDSKILAMRKIRFIMTGIASVADVDEAFERGAVASAGWPMDEEPTEDLNNFRISIEALERLQKLVDARAHHLEIESVLKQDPALTFKLLRHLNSAAFGNSLQIAKFKQVFLLIGYVNLARWIDAQILSAPPKDDNVFPLMHASLRRGLFMERLSVSSGQLNDACFMTGAFSLLDKITKTSFNRLFSIISISRDITDSVTSDSGVWSDLLSLIVAVEQNHNEAIRTIASKLDLDLAFVNESLLTALATADDAEEDDFEKNLT